jgi:cation transport ATPase
MTRMATEPYKHPAPPPDKPTSQSDEDTADERHLTTAEMMIGTAMMFIGFLNVLLSISGGFEINIFPLLIYFAGLAIWAHAAVRHTTIRYSIIAAAIILALAFFHYGEVLFWHKQVVFWTTIVLVGFFMFKGSKPSTP